MQDNLDRLAPVVFVFAFIALWGWESVSAARPRTGGHPRRRRRNLALSALNFLIGGASAGALLAASIWVAHFDWGLAALPQWLGVVAGVLLIDLTDYVRHRLSHHLPWLWRLHRVHHTDAQMDVTTSLRSHPLEQLVRPLFGAAAILLFGIPPLALAVSSLVQLPLLLFQHANVQLPPMCDRVLAWLIPTPALHLVHHSRQRVETDTNYGSALTIWDRLLGTLHHPVARPAIGLDGFDHPKHQSMLGMLTSPWAGRNLRSSVSR
jgi:sterol desaturase/sphingolipid hydroxylase (fatty acid hydroxylase superfamily)